MGKEDHFFVKQDLFENIQFFNAKAVFFTLSLTSVVGYCRFYFRTMETFNINKRYVTF